MRKTPASARAGARCGPLDDEIFVHAASASTAQTRTMMRSDMGSAAFCAFPEGACRE